MRIEMFNYYPFMHLRLTTNPMGGKDVEFMHKKYGFVVM
jgi:hypothetical protein